MYILSNEETDGLIAAAEEAGLNWDLESNVRANYSGRFMFGEQCFGFSAPSAGYVYFVLGVYAKTNQQLSMDLMNCHRLDNMGNDYIVYFPGYQWSEQPTYEAVTV